MSYKNQLKIIYKHVVVIIISPQNGHAGLASSLMHVSDVQNI